MTLLSMLTSEVPTLLRACTPSVFPDLGLAKVADVDVSVSFTRAGSLLEHRGTFDDIEQSVAALYGADRAWLSVSGTTGMNWVIARMLRYRLDADHVVLVGRNAHLSVVHALTDFGVAWEYIDGTYDANSESVLPTDDAQLTAALQAHTKVGAVWVTSPSYEGFVAEVRALADPCDATGIPLIVDEAWGAHFPADVTGLPRSAASQGADLVTASTHKTGGALQGTAVLVRPQNSRFGEREIDAAYASLTTTSPSYLLLASAEHAYARLNGAKNRADRGVADLLAAAAKLRADLANAGLTEIRTKDPIKFTLKLRVSGYAVAKEMAAHGVIVEKATASTVTVLVTFQQPAYATAAILTITADAIKAVAAAPAALTPPLTRARAMDPHAAHQLALQSGSLVPLTSAATKVAGEFVAAYPPGIPVLAPGDEITKDHADFLNAVLTAGGHLVSTGGHHQSPDHILVLP